MKWQIKTGECNTGNNENRSKEKRKYRVRLMGSQWEGKDSTAGKGWLLDRIGEMWKTERKKKVRV